MALFFIGLILGGAAGALIMAVLIGGDMNDDDIN